jgi:predicted PurR-regulated permease PerM
LVYLATGILAVAALYFGKPILMPFALATLFAFLLSPLVDKLCRIGLRQSIAVVIVVVLMFSLLGGMIWGFGRQLTALVYQLPDYRQNIQEKIEDLRNAGSGSGFERIKLAWRELKGELKKTSTTGATNVVAKATPETNAAPMELEPVPVVVKTPTSTGAWALPTAIGPLIEVLATAALVIVLVIFMLLRKRELRNRFILFFGYSRMPTTTRALDEAAERISRYLLMQTIINGSYGLAVGTAFYFIGLPYALMWGFLAALLRFIPYVGPWLGAIMPILLSLAVFPGWFHPFLVLGMILIFELASNMFMEPLLYGQTVGVSEVALIVAVAFWTWIWGPIGLALATPLTVCLVVLGKYVPGLSFLGLALGDEPVMEPPLLLYQRLLAMDDTEATEIAENYAKANGLIKTYDDLLLPALCSAKRDHDHEKFSTEHLEHMLETAGHIITKLAADAPKSTEEQTGLTTEVFGVPVKDTVDELVMSMLAHVLPASVKLNAISAEALSGEIMEEFEQRGGRVICVGAVSPGGTSESRYLTKRLQSAFPSTPIILARWGMKDEKKLREQGKSMEVTAVAVTLQEARNYLIELGRIAESNEPTERLQLEHN